MGYHKISYSALLNDNAKHSLRSHSTHDQSQKFQHRERWLLAALDGHVYSQYHTEACELLANLENGHSNFTSNDYS